MRNLLLIAIAVGIYFVSPNFAVVREATTVKHIDATLTSLLESKATRQEMIDALKVHVGQTSAGDVHIASIYKLLGAYDEAFCLLNSNDPKHQPLIAEIDFMQHGYLTEPGLEAISFWLSNEPDSPIALNILALDAMKRDDKEGAMIYWKQALSHLSPDSEAFDKIVSLVVQIAPEILQDPITVQIQGQIPEGAVIVLRDAKLEKPPLAIARCKPETLMSSLNKMVPDHVAQPGDLVRVVVKAGRSPESKTLVVSDVFNYQPQDVVVLTIGN